MLGVQASLGGLDDLADAPEAVKRHLSHGLLVFGKLTHEQRKKLLSFLVEHFPSDPNKLSLPTEFRLPNGDSKALLFAAYIIFTVFATSTEATASKVTELLNKTGILSTEEMPGVRQFATEVEEVRGQIRTGWRRLTLSDAVLPSFSNLAATVDLRLAFKEDEVDLHVPVAILFIDTDLRNHRLIFQATAEQIEGIIEDLQRTLNRMRIGEKWAAHNRK